MHCPFASYSCRTILKTKRERVDASEEVLNCDAVNMLLLSFAWMRSLPLNRVAILDSRMVSTFACKRTVPANLLQAARKAVCRVSERSTATGGLSIKHGCLLLVPIHFEFHWSMLALARGPDDTNAWVHYDSTYLHATYARNKVCKRLILHVFGGHLATFESPLVPQQHGAYECGYFALLYGWHLVQSVRLLLPKETLDCTQSEVLRFKDTLSSLLDRLAFVAKRRETTEAVRNKKITTY